MMKFQRHLDKAQQYLSMYESEAEDDEWFDALQSVLGAMRHLNELAGALSHQIDSEEELLARIDHLKQ